MSLGSGSNRRRRSATEWNELIDAYEHSTLTQREFCEFHGAAMSSSYKALTHVRAANTKRWQLHLLTLFRCKQRRTSTRPGSWCEWRSASA
jgi:hypothetical protein